MPAAILRTMAVKLLSCYVCMVAAVLSVGVLAQGATPSASALNSRKVLVSPPASPWTAPYNYFANAPLHTHAFEPPFPPMQPGSSTTPPPTTQILPLPSRPYPYFHTLPYPQPIPILGPVLCPRFPYPPPNVDQHGRLPPSASLYQNSGSYPFPYFPFPYTLRCLPLPLPFPMPTVGAPRPY